MWIGSRGSIWWDPALESSPVPFDTSLFGKNMMPFAYYLEHDGFAQIAKYKAVRRKHYDDYLPRSVELAQRMLAQIPEHRRWGQQLDCDWVTYTFGDFVRAKNGHRPCQPLFTTDLIIHLTGKGWARGTTDQPCFLDSPPVRYLRIDVDQDKAWRGAWRSSDADQEYYEFFEGQIWNTLHQQQRLMSELGLPYHVFRTGGRGVQLIVPLPSPTPHSVASLLLHGIREALRSCGGTDFRSSLDNVMRLPGGLHSTSVGFGLGLFVDLENKRLFDIDRQAQLMVDAFNWKPEGSSWTTEQYLADIADVGVHCQLGRKVLELDEADAIIDRLQHVPMIDSIRRMREAARGSATSVKPTTSDVPVCAFGRPKPEPLPTTGAGRTAWAQRVWAQGFRPHGFWSWFNMKEGKGVLAARLLFGEDEAEVKLIELAESTPAESSADIDQRIHTIRSSFRNWGKNGVKTPDTSHVLGEATPDAVRLSKKIVESIPRKFKAKWSAELAERVTLILLIVTAKKHGTISINRVCQELRDRWPDESVNRQSVREMLTRLVDEGAFLRTARSRASGEADSWMRGRLVEDLLNNTP